MNAKVYEIEARVEATHWWFTGRRRLFTDIITSLDLPRPIPVLDIGTGTGCNLRLLRGLSDRDHMVGIDNNPHAIRFCREKNLGEVSMGEICNLPFPAEKFHLVLATDVVEHVEDDARAMSEIARVLRPQGFAIITVPAFPCLWGRQDDVAHHKRRYKYRQMRTLVQSAGLSVRDIFYFNYILFFPIWAMRQVLRGIPLDSENQVNTELINRLLTRVFAVDIRTSRLLKPPFGVSLLAVAQKI